MTENNTSAMVSIDYIDAVLAFMADYVGDPDAGSTTPRHAAALINAAEVELGRLRALIDSEK